MPASDIVQNRAGDTEHKDGRGKMSSLSRRACYKCGNVGHYAEVCSSSERLCYNCKQPGHESNTCPHPRTTESTSLRLLRNFPAILLTLSHSKTMLPLPRSRPRSGRLPHPTSQRRCYRRPLLFLWSTRSSCSQLSQPGLCATNARRWWWWWSRWIRWFSRWIHGRWIHGRYQPCGDLLQMWWAKSLCAGLSGSDHEVLCLWQTGKFRFRGSLDLSNDNTRVISPAIVLRQTVVRSTRPERSVTSVAWLGTSLAIVHLPGPTVSWLSLPAYQQRAKLWLYQVVQQQRLQRQLLLNSPVAWIQPSSFANVS